MRTAVFLVVRFVWASSKLERALRNVNEWLAKLWQTAKSKARGRQENWDKTGGGRTRFTWALVWLRHVLPDQSHSTRFLAGAKQYWQCTWLYTAFLLSLLLYGTASEVRATHTIWHATKASTRRRPNKVLETTFAQIQEVLQYCYDSYTPNSEGLK